MQSCKVTSETMGGSICLEFLSIKQKSTTEPRTFRANRSRQQWPGHGGGKVSTTRRERCFCSPFPSRPIAVTFAGLAAISFMSSKDNSWGTKAVINVCFPEGFLLFGHRVIEIPGASLPSCGRFIGTSEGTI